MSSPFPSETASIPAVRFVRRSRSLQARTPLRAVDPSAFANERSFRAATAGFVASTVLASGLMVLLSTL